MENKNNVAVVIQNLVQFYNIRKGIDLLLNSGINVDIYIPKFEDNDGFKEIYDNAYNQIKKLKYNIKRTSDKNRHYKILLECYEIDNIIKINHDYRLRFRYGTLGTKPNKTLKPEFYVQFDGVMVYSKEEADYLSAFCRTELIGNLKFQGFQKKVNKNKKKKVLYLPTYGNASEIDDIIKIIENLNNKYDFIVKIHHGTSFLKAEKQKLELLKKLSSNFYDANEDLVELLKDADVVLSDNLGAIFDSVYAEVPVVIYSKKLNDEKVDDLFNTPQYDAVKDGYIPYTNDINNIEVIIEKGLTNEVKNQQKKLKEEIFYLPKDLTNDFLRVINKYLNDEISLKYKSLHDRLKQKIKEIEQLNNDVFQLKYEKEYYEKNYLNCQEENQKLLINCQKLEQELINKNKGIYTKLKNKIKDWRKK